MSGAVIVLVVLSLAFAWSMGAHYTGAVMGMPYASKSIRMWPALVTLSILTVLGATFASHGVQQTVGLHIVDTSRVDAQMLVIIEFGAFLLTTIYTYYKIPTSTIQILVFCVVGTALAASVTVHWEPVGTLAVTWLLAPPLAALLGFVFTKLLDVLVPEARKAVAGQPLVVLPRLLVLVGMAAAFVLGANDVSNAVGVWSAIHLSTLLIAGLAGGVAMAVGALTWGRRILNRVAFRHRQSRPGTGQRRPVRPGAGRPPGRQPGSLHLDEPGAGGRHVRYGPGQGPGDGADEDVAGHLQRLGDQSHHRWHPLLRALQADGRHRRRLRPKEEVAP